MTKYKKIIKELEAKSIIFKGFPHRRHRKRAKPLKSNKSLMLDKIIAKEHLNEVKSI